jgi:hypothetical protein
LLPSGRIRALGRAAVLAALRRSDDACAGLREEFDIPVRRPWVVALDGRGETLDSFPADDAARGCGKPSARRFPALLAARILRALARSESVQSLERRFGSSRSDEAFDALADRLLGSRAYRTLARVCAAAVADGALSTRIRTAARICSSIARLRTRGSGADDGAVVEEAGTLLARCADHARATSLTRALFWGGFSAEFDGAGKSAAFIARLRGRAAGSARGRALLRQARLMASLRRAWVRSLRRTIRLAPARDGAGFSRAYFGGLLGDADATIAFFGRPEWSRLREFRRWVEEAELKAPRPRSAVPVSTSRSSGG